MGGAVRGADIEKRLVALAADVCRISAGLPRSDIGRHVSKQLIRCGTSASANYAEARSAESRKDFVHKMKVCLKELRETMSWLSLLRELGMGKRRPVAFAISRAG
ncbi:MAG: four helix bundle protein [Gemmatimonadota bacterium]|nr:MAG: four helix bundle protein [Gemmatimonadota bacterium]